MLNFRANHVYDLTDESLWPLNESTFQPKQIASEIFIKFQRILNESSISWFEFYNLNYLYSSEFVSVSGFRLPMEISPLKYLYIYG